MYIFRQNILSSKNSSNRRTVNRRDMPIAVSEGPRISKHILQFNAAISRNLAHYKWKKVEMSESRPLDNFQRFEGVR